MAAEAQAFWKEWFEGERSVATLRRHVIPLLEQIRLASQRQDWPALQRLMETYSVAAPYCKDEPLLTTFEWGLMQINLVLADDMCVIGDLPRALEHVQYVKETLSQGDSRRQLHAMPFRPNSELRFTALGLQAICLLEDSALFVSQPEIESSLIAAEFWRASDTFVSSTREKHAGNEDRIRFSLHILSRYELEICKLCERYNPSFCVVAIDLFNGRYGNQLEAVVRHFESLDPEDGRTGWYWDFELAKLVSAADYTREEILHCAQQRQLGARLSFGSGPLPHMERLWSRQIHDWLGRL